jgi:L-cystine transport system substrate-binding protein
LDTGKYDIGSHWFGYNEDRAAKYLYATQPYNVTSYHIAVLEDDTTEYTNIDSLAGKTVFVSPGGNVANMLETYNETAETPINLYYGEQDNQIIISALTSGLVDAFISDDLSLYRWNQEYDTKVKGVGDALARTGTFFLFRQGEEELRDAVNGALEELVSDGTISKIATEYFGLDISATLDDAIEVG